jgi:hypothetical protein
VADGEHFPDTAEDHILLRHDPLQSKTVDGHTRDLLPPRPLVGVRSLHWPEGAAGGRDEFGRANSRARRRIDLARVMRLDDLDRVEEPCRHRGERAGENRAD